MTALPQRQQLVADILEAQSTGARLALACAELGLSVRSFERWRQSGEIRSDGRPLAIRPEPTHKLTPEERQRILDICHEPRFADLPPAQIVPQLADEGTYVASESSFYRVLRQARQQHHRGRSRTPVKTEPVRHIACGPNEIWSWDVTYLPSSVRGQFFYLYAVLDIFSRKLIAWEVHERESGDDAAALIERACWREQRRQQPLILHADNGAPQTSYTLKAKLESLGIRPSHSRPGVSDDNAHIEAWFRTCKYAASYPPNGFATIEDARNWVLQFVNWYNHQHRHSGLAFVTPQERHNGSYRAVLEQRREVYRIAHEQHPLRWKRHIRPWAVPDHVWLNPPSPSESRMVA